MLKTLKYFYTTNIYRTVLISASLILFLMCFSGNIEAQNETDSVVVISSKMRKYSRQWQAEHYKEYVPEVIPEYFILGTVNTYMGRFFRSLKEGQLDYYWNNEDSMVYCLKKYLKDKFRIDIELKKDERNVTVAYSSEWTKNINGYFDKNGSLKTDIFETDENIYSFLLGVYFRYGYKIADSVYGIRVSNSPDTKVIYSLLNEIGCDKIVYNCKRYLIPVPTQFYFEPSVLLEKYFNSIEPEYVVGKIEKSELLPEEKKLAEFFLFK